MRCVLIMNVIENQPGSKRYYCWDKKILHIATVEDWQDVIYGYYSSKDYETWGLGIKRNGHRSGRSAFYCQIVAPPMAQSILNGIEKEMRNENEIKIIKMIVNNYSVPVDTEIINKTEELLKAS